MDQELLKIIHIVPSEKILPFEWNSDSEFGLENNSDFNSSENVKHPFAVTELNSDNYLLLDSSETFYQYEKSGLKYLPVQILNNDDLEITALRLGLIQFGYDELLKLVEKYPSQIIIDEKLKNPGDEYMVLFFRFNNLPEMKVWLRNSSRSGCPVPLEIIFRSIYQNGRVIPIYDRRNNDESLTTVRYQTGSVLLPSFSLDDLKVAALAERYFPPSVINVVTRKRVLNIDFPMSILRSELPLKEMKDFLRELIVLRSQSRKTTSFNGQIYLLNQ